MPKAELFVSTFLRSPRSLLWAPQMQFLAAISFAMVRLRCRFEEAELPTLKFQTGKAKASFARNDRSAVDFTEEISGFSG